MEQTPGAVTKTVKDASPHEFVKAYSAHLKRSGKVPPILRCSRAAPSVFFISDEKFAFVPFFLCLSADKTPHFSNLASHKNHIELRGIYYLNRLFYYSCIYLFFPVTDNAMPVEQIKVIMYCWSCGTFMMSSVCGWAVSMILVMASEFPARGMY